nr:immunoglobulin light chain junction region [Macaca mulatta]MOW10509.1 immunoglobulin light chain junction region [Macaca mulatta]MOW13591.1 immunoglobulin light chain junction region [Macaca mulatta]
CQQHYNYPWTF